jgi:hypothetical protein
LHPAARKTIPIQLDGDHIVRDLVFLTGT